MPLDAELSRAVTTYVTTRPHGYPHQDPAALAVQFGAQSAAALKPRIDALLGELFAPPFTAIATSGSYDGLADLYRAAEAAFAQRHPELSPEAVAALVLYYTYCSK